MQYMMEACLTYAVLFMLMGAMALIWLPGRWVMRRIERIRNKSDQDSKGGDT